MKVSSLNRQVKPTSKRTCERISFSNAVKILVKFILDFFPSSSHRLSQLLRSFLNKWCENIWEQTITHSDFLSPFRPTVILFFFHYLFSINNENGTNIISVSFCTIFHALFPSCSALFFSNSLFSPFYFIFICLPFLAILLLFFSIRYILGPYIIFFLVRLVYQTPQCTKFYLYQIKDVMSERVVKANVSIGYWMPGWSVTLKL